MQPLFNDLSTKPLLGEVKEIENSVNKYAEVLKETFKRIGSKKILYAKRLGDVMIGKGVSLKSYISSHLNDPNAMFLLNSADYPYIKDNDEKAIETYVDSKKISVNIEGQNIESESFASAYCLGSFCVGFQNKKFADLKVTLDVVDGNGRKSNPIVYLISDLIQLDDYQFVDWLIKNNELQLAKVCALPQNKPVHIYDHHGQDVIEAYVKRIINLDFVKGVPNTLKFRPKEKGFVHKIRNNFQLEVVLYKEKKVKCSLLIDTTARNLREAKYIASLLEEKY